MEPKPRFRIGTRGSPLALAQAREVRDRLMASPGLDDESFEIVVIRTSGDRIQDRALREIGGKGLFTKEIEEALLAGRIDIAVHSAKDMPAEQPEGLVLDVFLPREDVRDAFVSPGYSRIADLPEGAVVGTSSVRRRAQLLHCRRDLRVVEFRGNVQTRLAKLADGIADATFLAMAGLNRLDARHVPHMPIEPEEMLPAPGQGAVVIERRRNDIGTRAMTEPIRDRLTCLRLAAERAFLAELDGSCATPIAALAEISDGILRLRGEILRPDGSERLFDEVSGTVESGKDLGRELAKALLVRAGEDFFTRPSLDFGMPDRETRAQAIGMNAVSGRRGQRE